jgi:hypothetical protein
VNLIVVADIVNPPTEILPFRDVTRMAKFDFLMNVLLESEQDLKDIYWKFMRPRGMFDYIDDIITPREKEEGLRIDAERNHPKTMIVKSITLNNERLLISKLSVFMTFTSRN